MSNSRPSARLRTQVTERANNCCDYCLSQARYAPDSFSIEHIIPRAKNGKTMLNNLALACQGCNNHKYSYAEAIFPVSGKVRCFLTHASKIGQSILAGVKILHILLD